MKDWLSYEQSRNKANASLYERILTIADLGPDIAVLIGHHIGFEFNKDLSTENEIPSADTLIFDHDIMSRVFGSRFVAIMAELATVPADRRDSALKRHLELKYGPDTRKQPAQQQQQSELVTGYVLRP